jgi:urease accessory protein UreH
MSYHARGADYQQMQSIELERGANLVLVDWFTSGRCV